MRQSHLYLFGFAALVAACQPVTPSAVNSPSTAPAITQNNASPVPAQDPAITAPAVTPAPSEIDIAVSTITSASNNAADAMASLAAPAAATPIKPPFAPENMIGSAAVVLTSDLGAAVMIRQEGTIEIWQYRFPECVVDFFFYPVSDGSSQMIVKDWDMRSAVIGGRVNDSRCRAAMDSHHQRLVAGS